MVVFRGPKCQLDRCAPRLFPKVKPICGSELGQSCPEFCPHRPILHELCQMLTQADQISTIAWPRSTTVGRSLVNVDNVRPTLVAVGPNPLLTMANLGQRLTQHRQDLQNKGQASTKFGRNLPNNDQHRPHLGQISSLWATHWSRFGQCLLINWKNSCNIGRFRANFGQVRPHKVILRP